MQNSKASAADGIIGRDKFCVGCRATDEEFAEDDGEDFDGLVPAGKDIRG